MASNREERRAHRQRGVVRHEVQDVEFGSPFPADIAMPVHRITRSVTTPQPRAKTPQKPTTPTAATADANTSANISAKRRRLDVEQTVPHSSETRSTRSRATPRRDIFSLEDEPAAEVVEKRIEAGPITHGNTQATEQALTPKRLHTPRGGRDNEEVAESPGDVPGSGRRTRMILDESQALEREERRRQRDRGAGRRQVEGVDFGTPFVPAPVEPVVQIEPKAAIPAAEPLSQAATPDHPDLSLRKSPVRTAPSPRLPIRRSPRVSKGVVLVEDVDELSPDRQESSRLIQQDEFHDIERPDEEEAEAIDDNEATKYLRRPLKRKSSPLDLDLEAQTQEEPPQEQEEEIELEEDDEPSLIEPTALEKLPRGRKPKAKGSPAAQRQPKKPKAKPKSKTKSASTKPRNRKSGETIPVIVHRLTKPHVYDEDGTDADVLNEDVPYSKRSGVNAVDVLSQFCDEVIESGLTALEEGGSTAEDAATRREYNTKLRAVEAFGEELRTRLLELTIVLDADYHLNKRVRAAQKEKVQLREGLLALRAQREQIALRMDEVRIKHEDGSREAQDQATLNTSLHDIELAVPLRKEGSAGAGVAEDLTPPDISTLVKEVAGIVSSKSAQGGILKQVKDFNAFLERAALALEGRSGK